MSGKSPSAPRVAALVGPYLSGKTSLLEALLAHAGALPKKGNVKEHTTVGDASAEAKARNMSLEVSVATCDYQGESWTFLDCPGSVEFQQESLHALMVADVAIVVVEPDPHKAITAAPILKALDDHQVPHVVFVNKMDGGGAKLADVLAGLQGVSERPLVLLEIPIREGDAITGFVDLISEHAYGYKPHEDAALASLPESILPEEEHARREMLEHLADFDDHLMEELLEDVQPAQAEVYDSLAKDIQMDLVVPVLFGSAEEDHGIRRLMKVLRHEAPGPDVTAERLKIPKEPVLAQVFKTLHAQHVGKQSLSRIWSGEITDGMTLNGGRVSGIQRFFGGTLTKIPKAGKGEIVSLGRLDEAQTGQGLTPGRTLDLDWPKVLQPCFALALKVTKSGDDVKLGASLAKLCEEDPSLRFTQTPDTHELVLSGQGEVHLKNALERLKNRYNVEVKSERAQVPYKETLRKPVHQHGRYKHQSGGHGAFGDVVLDIKPRPRGEGYVFEEKIVGGVIPRQYFSSVDNGVQDYMKQGPMGFQVVDLHVSLVHGSYHTVDSSDMAFKAAARVAMTEGMPNGSPVLLEPIISVCISIPSEFTAKAQRLVTGRRAGQILGFDQKEGWTNWDVVNALIPQAEMHDLILELRSLTLGLGSYTWEFAHLQEIEGREADLVVKTRKAALAE